MKRDLNPHSSLQMRLVCQLTYSVVVVKDVLLHEAPIPFGYQDTSRPHMLSVCGLITISDRSRPRLTVTKLLMGNALVAARTKSLTRRTHCSTPQHYPRGSGLRSCSRQIGLLATLQPSSLALDCLTSSRVWCTISGDWQPASLSLPHGSLSPHTVFLATTLSHASQRVKCPHLDSNQGPVD